jgi:hypothetical protein
MLVSYLIIPQHQNSEDPDERVISDFHGAEGLDADVGDIGGTNQPLGRSLQCRSLETGYFSQSLRFTLP